MELVAVSFPLDVTDLKYLAGKAVELRGEDYVYDFKRGHCTYWNKLDDCPSCLIGTILWLAGVPREEIMRGDSDAHTTLKSIRNNAVLTKYFTAEALPYAIVLQVEQDVRTPWGEAVKIVFGDYVPESK